MPPPPATRVVRFPPQPANRSPVVAEPAGLGPAAIAVRTRAICSAGFATDVSSDAVSVILPLFLTRTLLLSAAAVGLVEGVVIAAMALAAWSATMFADRGRGRGLVTRAAYVVPLAARLLLPTSSSIWAVLSSTLADGASRGLRASTRARLLAEVSTRFTATAAAGLQRSLDIFGSLPTNLAAGCLWAAIGPEFVFGAATTGALLAAFRLWRESPAGGELGAAFPAFGDARR